MNLRIGNCPHCQRRRTFRAGEVKRRTRKGLLVFPFIECRTCGRRHKDPQRSPHIDLVQREFAFEPRK